MSVQDVFDSLFFAVFIPVSFACAARRVRQRRGWLALIFAATIGMTVSLGLSWFHWVHEPGHSTWWWSFFFSPQAPFGISIVAGYCLAFAVDLARKERADRASTKSDA